jgi:uracil-DNA glycosylase
MSSQNVKIEEQWKIALEDEFDQPYFHEIKAYLLGEKKAGKIIYPPGKLIFNAFDSTPFDKVKVVILGQDPYHNPGQAMGLSFSVPKGVKIPPSLRNIYKEINADVGASIPDHGDLTDWASQGVFLLNAMLTVEQNKPSSHSKIGWQNFTDAVIKTLSDKRSNIVFMLWGRFAQNKSNLIDASKHLVLTSAHPSPLAGGAFFNNHHFSKANEYLKAHQKTPINWEIKP